MVPTLRIGRLADRESGSKRRSGQGRLCEKLLDLGVPVDARDERQTTALIHAAGQGRVDLPELLLRRGAEFPRSRE